ncbi:MAG: aspartate 1-decarboxylase [Alphaproteobacteria bacterium]|nr:aspartate 1-decarboxylase [Alphaproteobacteria bacterium]
MTVTMLKAKIHRATVTQCDLHYEGSITVAEDLLEASGIMPYEQVDVLNINNGERFTTYAITGKAGSGIIGINGAAARLAQKGDLVIICAYEAMSKESAQEHAPTVLLMDEQNRIEKYPVLKEAV